MKKLKRYIFKEKKKFQEVSLGMAQNFIADYLQVYSIDEIKEAAQEFLKMIEEISGDAFQENKKLFLKELNRLLGQKGYK